MNMDLNERFLKTTSDLFGLDHVSRYFNKRVTGFVSIKLVELIDRMKEQRKLKSLSISLIAHTEECEASIFFGTSRVGKAKKVVKTADGSASYITFTVPEKFQARLLHFYSIEFSGDMTLQSITAVFAPGTTDDNFEISMPIFEHFSLGSGFNLASKMRKNNWINPECIINGFILQGYTKQIAGFSVKLGKKIYSCSKFSLSQPQRVWLTPKIKFKDFKDVQFVFFGEVFILRITLLISPHRVFKLAATQKLLRINKNISESVFFNAYDESQPVVFHHIPKHAGSSFRQILKEWFKGRYCEHYFDSNSNKPHVRHHLSASSMIAGHFTRSVGMSLEEYYPEVRQKISIIRDPFDAAVSRYFYLKKEKIGQYQIASSLQQELENNLSIRGYQVFDHLPLKPPEQSIEEYVKTNFLYIGLAECLQASTNNMALLFGKPAMIVQVKNDSIYDEPVPDLKGAFREKFKAEYELYDYIKGLHRAAGLVE